MSKTTGEDGMATKNTRTIGYGGNDVVKPAEEPNFDELAADIVGVSEEQAVAQPEPDLPTVGTVFRDSLERTHSARDVLSYYPIEVKHPLDPDREPYTVDAIDIIEALGMSYSEGSLFKALWRKCAVRQGVYRREQSDAQKMLFFSHRVLGDDVTPKGKKA